MKIDSIRNGVLFQTPEIKPPHDKDSFKELMVDFVQDVNKNQHASSDMLNRFVEGDDVELHEVMIAGQKAKTSLELLMEVRNKALDMYTELTRMQ